MSETTNLSRVNRRSSTGTVTFGDATYRPGGSCGPRVQTDHQLVAVLSGEAAVCSGDLRFTLLPGQVVLMEPNRMELFRFSARASTRHLWVSVSPTRFAFEGSSLRPTPFSSRLSSLIEMGLSVPAAKEADRLVEELGAACLACFAYDVASRARGELDEPVAKACALMRRAIERQMCLADLAYHAGVSPQHLIRLFRRSLGETPMEHLWSLRVRLGADMLRETGLSVSEVAERCGFQNPHHFSRRLKAAYGVAPSEWRKQSWNRLSEPCILGAEGST